MANAIAAEPIMQSITSSPFYGGAHTAGLQIDAPLATIRGIDVVDASALIHLRRSEHYL